MTLILLDSVISGPSYFKWKNNSWYEQHHAEYTFSASDDASADDFLAARAEANIKGSDGWIECTQPAHHGHTSVQTQVNVFQYWGPSGAHPSRLRDRWRRVRWSSVCFSLRHYCFRFFFSLRLKHLASNICLLLPSELHFPTGLLWRYRIRFLYFLIANLIFCEAEHSLGWAADPRDGRSADGTVWRNPPICWKED